MFEYPLEVIEARVAERENMTRKLHRAVRAFKRANQKRHHAEARADDLALQRNQWRAGFQDMQRKRNETERERDLVIAENDKLREENIRLKELQIALSCEFCNGTGINPWPLMGPRDCPECHGKKYVLARKV